MKFHLAGWLVKAKRIDRVVQCFYCVENGSLEYSNPGQNKVFFVWVVDGARTVDIEDEHGSDQNNHVRPEKVQLGGASRPNEPRRRSPPNRKRNICLMTAICQPPSSPDT